MYVCIGSCWFTVDCLDLHPVLDEWLGTSLQYLSTHIHVDIHCILLYTMSRFHALYLLIGHLPVNRFHHSAQCRQCIYWVLIFSSTPIECNFAFKPLPQELVLSLRAPFLTTLIFFPHAAIVGVGGGLESCFLGKLNVLLKCLELQWPYMFRFLNIWRSTSVRLLEKMYGERKVPLE